MRLYKERDNLKMLWPYVTLQSSLMEFANSLMNSCGWFVVYVSVTSQNSRKKNEQNNKN